MKTRLVASAFNCRSFILTLIVFLGIFVDVSIGQIPGSYRIGFPENADFSGTEFESVQINNNDLHIDIPLVSMPGRGLSYSSRYVYDSKGWGFTEHCVHHILDTCTDRASNHPSANGVSCCAANNLQWTLVSSADFTTSVVSTVVTCTAGNQLSVYTFYLHGPAGTHHHFKPDHVGPPNPCDGKWIYATTVNADDGSGWIMHVDPSTGAIQSVVGKDGSLGGNEDSNGNQIVSGTSDTLGRTVAKNIYHDSSGALQNIVTTTQPVAIETNLCQFSSADFCYEVTSTTWNMPQVITLPNGMTYTFTYDQGSPSHPYYGQPLSVTLPTGGQIMWGWGAEQPNGPVLLTRQLSGDPAPWVYSASGNVGSTVIDPAGNETDTTLASYAPYKAANYCSGGVAENCGTYVTQTKSYQGSSSGTLIKTVQTDFDTTYAVVPIRETTTWNQPNLVSKVETDYDHFVVGPGTSTASNPIEKREFGFGIGSPGGLLRTTAYGYLHLTNSTYLGLNIVDRETSSKVYAGSSQSGTLMAQTLKTYDGVAIPTSGDTSGSPAPNHDYVNFSRTNNLRGNLTQVSRGLNSGGTWTWKNTNNTYNDLGEVLTSADPLGHTTAFDYADAWASISNPQCVTSTHSYAFPTTITDALGHQIKRTYYSCTSLTGSTKDQNDIVNGRTGTTFAYDLLNRALTTNHPDGGQTSQSYVDTAPLSTIVTTLLDSTAGLSTQTTKIFDSFGRVQQTQVRDPDCTSGLANADHTYGYDNAASPPGRFTTVSNPYCSNGSSTGITKTRYDAVDRAVRMIPQDGTDASNNVSTSYGLCSGSTALGITVADEVGRARQSCSDALGRLTQVFEDPGTAPHLNYRTDYAYDVLDNLTSVTQNGNGTARTRSFTYDSLSRLTCAANPEVTPGLSTVSPASCPATYVSGSYTNGTIGYTYDDDSNVATKRAPAPNQLLTSSTVLTTYSYDTVHRLTQKSYSGGPSTPTVKYAYDGNALTCTPVTPSVTDSNPINYRTSMCDGSGASAWSHDEMGRTKVAKRTTVGSTNPTLALIYGYNKDGSLATVQYPSNRAITYQPNSSGSYTAGRTVSAKDLTNATNYVTAATYTPFGAISALTNGVSIKAMLSYNSRLQPLQMAYGTGTMPSQTEINQATCPATIANIMHRDYHFALGANDNGNVQSIDNCRDTNRTQNFDYDAVNRIAHAYTTGLNWGETYTIDAWGNLTNIGSYTDGSGTRTGGEILNLAPASAKNQVNGLCNDAAGNLIWNTGNCPTGTFTPTHTYDAENRLLSTAGWTYGYDGDGNRVEKCNSCTSASGGTLYWSGSGTDPLVETNLAGTLQNEYIFLNGKRIARRDSTNVVTYYMADHLGSANVVASSAGAIRDESDYYPYGGEISYSNAVPQNYKFTGKERDVESGLDDFEARHYNSAWGRFMTPDWAAKPISVPYANFGNPQSLNLYSYVQNGPTTTGDPDGHCPGDFTNCKKMATNPLSSVSPETKQAINNSVKESDSPTADDKKGGSHEEGGVAYTKNGVQTVAPAQAGKFQDVKQPGEAKMDPFKAANPSQQKPGDVKADVEWHVHPSAQVTETTGSQSLPGAVVFGGTVSTTTYQFNQPPSDVDIQNAGAANLSIAVGARDKTVYVYDTSGCTCKESLKDFNKEPK